MRLLITFWGAYRPLYSISSWDSIRNLATWTNQLFCCLVCMWHSRVENEHSVPMFNAYSNASGYCLCGSRSLAPLRMCAMSYGQQNTARLGIADHCNYCHVSKNRQKRSRQGAVRVHGRLFVDCALV